ncbi:hypothetical protein PC110_g4696 [Phytophthora cactorum]|uniref:Uncharacterized protein n=1 Tax=Phytophthora cactorum TaxID=29920 RepID=A0A329SR96_9STRA|nr:hypothetical protein PC115_g2872 [Phytophthora cactorum]KAG3100793.1 hypothetical protein PC122_g2960 [Phytophthora cactorum]RAW39095.1 hypothetical protein PC110_g4696 [Phytophthora cactorum]
MAKALTKLERLKGAKKKLEDELVATREEYEQLVQDLTTKAESARKHECVQFNLKFDKDDKRIEALKAEVAALRSTQEQQQQERERMQTQEQQLQVQTLELQALTEHSTFRVGKEFECHSHMVAITESSLLHTMPGKW